MKKRLLIIIGVIVLALAVIVLCIHFKNKNEKPYIPHEPENPIATTESDFDYKIIKSVNTKYKENYLVSPLSMAYALTILNEGASNETKEQIDTLLNNYKLPSLINIKDRISMANVLFVRNTYKDEISNNYINKIKNDYSSDLLLDEFKTPDKINNWIEEKTYNMIKKPIDNLSKDFVLGIANAIAIDVEWKNKFECGKTIEDDFTKVDGSTMKTAMMNSDEDVLYIKNDKAQGIIKDYSIYDKNTGKIVYEENENTLALEYIAILPNEGIDKYMQSFNKTELDNLLKTKANYTDKIINYSIPKYTYDFNYEEFQDDLKKLGMTNAFNNTANFSKMVKENSKLQLYVSQSIHKSHIELSENGTKAAAVTIFIMDKATSIIDEPEKINIEFNKPFIYIIKEKNNDNIWFFGAVYEPIKWEDNTSNCTYE